MRRRPLTMIDRRGGSGAIGNSESAPRDILGGMKLVVQQVYPPQAGTTSSIAIVAAVNGGPFELEVGSVLRCGGYRYNVSEVRATNLGHSKGLVLESEYGLRPGMILRRSTDPLANDEFAAALMRLAHLLHLFAELEVDGVVERLEHPDDLMVKFLEKAGVLSDFRSVFSNLSRLQQHFPQLAAQRQMATAAATMNDELGVIQLGGDRAEVAS